MRIGTVTLHGLSDQEISNLLPDNLILLGFRGSIAHEMYVPQDHPDSIDDKDIMGVYVGPKELYIGFDRKEQKEKVHNEWDAVSYEIRKMCSLLEKGNPNVLSLLWLPDKHYIWKHALGARLVLNRNLFATRQVYHSFNGYAWGQFKRMTNYKFEGYMGQKRKELVDRYGYDCKNAAHLIRLLKMGIEFLSEGYLYVGRSDAEMLLSVKHGEWALDRVKTEAERLFRLAEESYVKSKLPDRPDHKAVESLVMGIIEDFHLWS